MAVVFVLAEVALVCVALVASVPLTTALELKRDANRAIRVLVPLLLLLAAPC